MNATGIVECEFTEPISKTSHKCASAKKVETIKANFEAVPISNTMRVRSVL